MNVQTIYWQDFTLDLYTVYLHFTGLLVRFPELSGVWEIWLVFASITKNSWGMEMLSVKMEKL